MIDKENFEKRCQQLRERMSPGHAQRVAERNKRLMRNNRRNRNSWHHEAAKAFIIELIDRKKYVRSQ
jgi:hypothetical protein